LANTRAEKEMDEGKSEQKKKVRVAMDESECSHYMLLWDLNNLHETIANSELVLFVVQPIFYLSYAMISTLGVARMFLSLLICSFNNLQSIKLRVSL
jgi:hypothetical protein